MDGQFTIRAKKGNTLIFSFIGYQTVEQKATDTPMKVTLQESSVQVDEVVVTALGIKKEKKALVFAPVNPLKFKSFTTNMQDVVDLYKEGYMVASQNIEKVKKFV